MCGWESVCEGDFVLRYLLLVVEARLGDGLRHLFPTILVLVWVDKCTTDTDQGTASSSRLSNVISGIPGVSDSINDRPENVFQTVRTRCHGNGKV